MIPFNSIRHLFYWKLDWQDVIINCAIFNSSKHFSSIVNFNDYGFTIYLILNYDCLIEKLFYSTFARLFYFWLESLFILWIRNEDTSCKNQCWYVIYQLWKIYNALILYFVLLWNKIIFFIPFDIWKISILSLLDRYISSVHPHQRLIEKGLKSIG